MNRCSNAWVCMLFVTVLLTGCIQSEESYTLNPDGSGKVGYQIRLPLGPDMMGSQQRSLETKAKSSAERILSESRGVAAWKDVSWTITEDGQLDFRGTAYFADFNAVTISQGEMKANSNEKLVFQNIDGNRIVLQSRRTPTTEPAKSSVDSSSLQQSAKEKRMEFLQMRTMMEAMLKNMRIVKHFALPGKRVAMDAFTAAEDGSSVTLLFDGNKILGQFDAIANDMSMWEAEAGKPREDMQGGPSMDLFNRYLFDTTNAPRVETEAPFAPLFDYAAEVAEATLAFPAMKKSLGLDHAEVPSVPASGEGLSNVRLAGAQFVFESDRDSQMRPFNSDIGCKLSIIVDFDGAVLEVKDVEITAAETASGIDLLAMNNVDKVTSSTDLSKDKTSAMFDVSFANPESDMKGLNRLAGNINYITGGKTEPVDLGILDLKVGTLAEPMQAEIKSVGPSKWDRNDNAQEVELYLAVNPKSIHAVRFEDIEGKPLEFDRNGSMSSPSQVTYTFKYKGSLPEKVRILVDRYVDLKEFIAPFELTNLNLLGKRP